MKENIFIWKEYQFWEKSFGDFLENILPSNFNTKLKAHQNEIYCDWAGPFEELIHDEYDNGYFDSEFTEYFINTFSHILTFHACRTSDIQSYYRNGLLILDVSMQNENFSNLFFNDHFPEISKDDINFAINEMKKENRKNQLFLGLDDRPLIETAGHYLIYGSEYVMCLATYLSKRFKKDYQFYLRSIGEPTIFKVKLPVSKIKADDIIYLFPELLRIWIYNNANNKNISVKLDYSFFLKNNISPNCIIKHYHPNEIRDYHNKGKIYIRKTNSYRIDDLSAI